MLKGLVNLTVEQDLEGCEHTVKELANLFSLFSDDLSIALENAERIGKLEYCKRVIRGIDRDFR